MTMHRSKMSENARIGCFVFLFPPLWPLGLAWALVAAVEGIANGVRSLYARWRNRKTLRAENEKLRAALKLSQDTVAAYEQAKES